ncbi:hypothetical protein GIB67_021656 [Kingdonia uniflora]|uniref:Uncharacterized protein n=1 Tax=Kingdonia uniflora TaxID=39325 RepID=A0A7J7KYD8_9MAGN|nr:hypothetical protein GIB67_021656 [Kingdonia uniflora]
MDHVSTGDHVDTRDASNFDGEPLITPINLEPNNHDFYDDVDRNGVPYVYFNFLNPENEVNVHFTNEDDHNLSKLSLVDVNLQVRNADPL